ncbi:MAG: hypothetical protein L6R42_005493 [Xanthoria sp. 1 TBL-2021]|nr:MAG: hypothetical protein L6R42_005493 [Xanthoria sp. 1 TBL-2021]
MRAQEQTVRALHANTDDHVVLWGSSCQDPRQLDTVGSRYFYSSGGTCPSSILEHPHAVHLIQDSDVWILLTDGKIHSSKVDELGNLAEELNILKTPIILVITGERHGGPAQANISVGVTFFAAAHEALILFKVASSGELFVIDAKGAFARLRNEDSDYTSGWSSLARFANEARFNSRCKELEIVGTPSATRPNTRAVSLGTEWDSATGKALVNVPLLLQQAQIKTSDIRNMLAEEAFTQLTLLCKTRGRLGALRDLLIRHKKQDVVVRLEDIHGAGKVMEKLQSKTVLEDEKNKLREQLRQAHAANREKYLKLRNEPSEEQREASELNRSINQALQIIAAFEKSSYTADILNRKSNRAMRASTVSAQDGKIDVAALDLSNDIEAFRGACSICCEDEQIMSIVLKHLDTIEENTTDFALNFPLAAAQAKQNKDMISAQCICFQCAQALRVSIFQEHIVATIPTVEYKGANKKYIDHQLTLAVTAGLATGASGIAQLFATILDRTLETKDWCSCDQTEDAEVQTRREAFEWMLLNLLERSFCRENFGENETWVLYPKALLWAFKEYETAGLDSWIIQYPLAGFSQILRWAELLRLPIDAERIQAVRAAKLIHQIVTVMMSELLREKDGDKLWTYRFLHLIYREFNAPGIPRDLGVESLIPSDVCWMPLEGALGSWQDVTRFLALFDTEAREAVISRLQLVTFWVLYTQKGHTTPKTFFATIASREPLAPAVLDPAAPHLPQNEVKKVLLSIFCDKARPRDSLTAHMQDIHLGYAMPPFATPFGASVLSCGFPGCGTEFYSPNDIQKGVEAAANGIHTRRANHFAAVFGIPGKFQSLTGLPDPTLAPKAPSSYHNTLHISIARAWSQLSLGKKEAIIRSAKGDNNNSAIDSFVVDVRIELCATSHRGDIYSATIDDEVRRLLPSFWEVLKIASERMGLDDRSGAAYVHDWTKNKIVAKMEYELGSSTQPFFVHADVLARSDILRKLVQGSWKESMEQTIRWTEWDNASVEKFIQWLYTDDYTCPYPTPIAWPVEENAGEDRQIEISQAPSNAHVALAQMDDTNPNSDATEEPPAKKQKMLPVKDLTWSGTNPAPKLSQTEDFDKWPGHQLWSPQQLDYSAPFGTHAELYIMGCRYFLDDLRSMAWSRLRAVLVTIGRPVPGSPVIANIMDLILGIYDKLGDPVGDEEPLKSLLTIFVAHNFTAFEASGIEDWATSDNKIAREFVPDLMAKLMLKVKELEDEGPKPSPFAAPPASIGSGAFGFSGSNEPNPMVHSRPYGGRGRR